ncbi:acyl carrier protein [Streptomyces sp. NPDC017943]|uniref:acyl carrier protein n=1 Tax=Streptomyces sp. NPDC017943 TaxID=3365019 RepID=UPI00379838CD
MTAQTTATTAPAELVQAVLDVVRGKFEAPQDATATTPYEDMDFDSLVLLELAVHLSQVYEVQITDDEILDASNVAETARLLAAKGVRLAR